MHYIKDPDLWDKIKIEYITSNIAARELAKKYGVSYSTLSKNAKRGQWYTKRKKFKENLEAKVLRQGLREQSKALAKEIRFLEQIEKHLKNILQDEEQFFKHLVTETSAEGDITTLERRFTKADTKALKEVMNVAREAERMRRSLFGVLTKPQEESVRIAKKRLELEEERIKKDDKKDTSVVIKFDGDLGDYGD